MPQTRRNKRFTPLIIGLTGSIGMGKTTIARMFRQLGIPVCDSDALVHRLLSTGGAAVDKVAQLFPSTRGENGIDRKALGREVFDNPRALAALEAILHPLVRAGQQQFIHRMQRMGIKRVMLDIPLLFETHAERRCDVVVVVQAPQFIQKQRVLSRPSMTKERLQRILARQWPSRKKCRHADKVIPTGLGKAVSFRAVKEWCSTI